MPNRGSSVPLVSESAETVTGTHAATPATGAMTPKLSTFLDASRWIAAGLVAAHHVRHLVLADASATIALNPVLDVFYFVTGLGGDAVVVFFVVSGYLVGGRAIVRYPSRGFDLGDYALHRTSRIYTVLVPALAFGALLDAIGLRDFNRSGIYTNGAHHESLRTFMSISNNLNVGTFVGNLFMLENVVVRRLGTNNPLWSLAYEWWYYALFAAALLLATERSVATRTIAGVAVAAMLVLLPHELVLFATIWLVGVATAVYARTAYGKPPRWIGYLALALVLAGLRFTEHASAAAAHAQAANVVRAGAVAVSYALLLLAYHRPGPRLAFERVHARFARFSYTLYLVHYPMIVFCVALLDTAFHVGFLRRPDVAGLSYFALLLAFVVAYGFAFSELTERHTARVRTGLSDVLCAMRRWISVRTPS